MSEILSLHLVIVAASQAEREAFELPFGFPTEPLAELSLIVNPPGRSLARVGNEALESSAADVVGLCHADTSFGLGALAAFTAAAQAGAIAGIVGIDAKRVYRWSKDNPGPVSTLDSCSVFLRRDCGLRFDELVFDGLHCHVEDLCLQARARGIPVVVPAAQADHAGRRTAQPEWQAEYARYRYALGRKWRGVEFETT